MERFESRFLSLHSPIIRPRQMIRQESFQFRDPSPPFSSFPNSNNRTLKTVYPHFSNQKPLNLKTAVQDN